MRAHPPHPPIRVSPRMICFLNFQISQGASHENKIRQSSQRQHPAHAPQDTRAPTQLEHPRTPRTPHQQVPGVPAHAWNDARRKHPRQTYGCRSSAEDGTYGLGQCSFGELTATLVDYHFGPLLEGRDCFATEFLNDLMWRSTQRFGAGGIATVAQSGIDLALWDLKGKLLEQPVYRLLGGPCRDKIDIYVTSDDLDWSMELGFHAFKVSNPVHYEEGIDGLNILDEHIGKARDMVGYDVELMYNPVMSFNVEFAIRVAERLRSTACAGWKSR